MEMFSTPRTASTSTTAEAASHVDGCPKSEQGTLGEPSNVGVHNVARVSSIDNEAGDRSNDPIGVGGVQFKKGPWTAMEDAILIEYVKARGEGNWNSVQRYSGLARCGKSCRLRWANHLRPNLKKGAFSPDEERLIVKWHAEFGNKWARMAALLPGRTDNEIKNYWNTRVKRHRRLGIPLYPSDIQPNPDIPPPKPHPSHRHHQFRRDLHSSPPTTSTAFAFQTQLPSSITPSTKPLFIINPTSISSRHYPLPSLCTPAPPFPSSFTFQTQPLPSHNPHIPTPPTTTPTDTSPATTTSTLPLFDFGLPITTPQIPVQTSLRFRRDPSFSFTTPTIVNPHPFSLSLQQFSPASTATETTPPHISPIASPLPPSCFTDFFTTTAIHTPDFQKEMEEENERICLLLADIAHHSHQQQPPPPELPSTQFLSPSSSHGNLLGMTTAVAAATTTTAATGDGNIKRVTRKRKILDEHHEGGEQDHQEVFFVEDLLAQEPGDQGCYRKQNRCMINHDDQEKYRLDGFPGTWNHSGSPISSSPGFAPNLETTGQQNMTTPEDLTRTCIQAEDINCETGDISNDRSSVITDDNNIGLEMHHVASLFATTRDHDRATLDACSWDNLPEMC